MPLPVAHGLLGASAVAIMRGRASENPHWKRLSLGAALAISPDIDVFFSAVLGLGDSWHGSFSHSATFAVLAGLLVPWAFGISPLKNNLAFVCATLSHGLSDALTGKQIHAGEELLWPFSMHRFRLGVVDYFQLGPVGEQPFFQTAEAVLRISLIEAMVCIPLFLLALHFGRHRSRS